MCRLIGPQTGELGLAHCRLQATSVLGFDSKVCHSGHSPVGVPDQHGAPKPQLPTEAAGTPLQNALGQFLQDAHPSSHRGALGLKFLVACVGYGHVSPAWGSCSTQVSEFTRWKGDCLTHKPQAVSGRDAWHFWDTSRSHSPLLPDIPGDATAGRW